MCDWFNKKYLSWQINPQVEDCEEMEELTGELIPPKSKLLSLVEYGNPSETSLETTNVLTYELGDLVKNLFYAKIYPERKQMHMIEAKIALMDLLTQCMIICDREGWNFNELVLMGAERIIERIERRMKLRE